MGLAGGSFWGGENRARFAPDSYSRNSNPVRIEQETPREKSLFFRFDSRRATIVENLSECVGASAARRA